jgi:hypothetical protein
MTTPEGPDRADAGFAALSDAALRRTYGLAGYLLGNATYDYVFVGDLTP